MTAPLSGDRPLTLERVSDRVTVGLGPVQGDRAMSNSTVVAGGLVTMVVDTMISPELVAPVAAAAVGLGGRPVGLVLNTHGDPDHVGGNGAFPEARVVAHRLVAELGKAHVDEPFEESWATDLGDLPVEVTYVGPAHSDADSFAWLPTEGVAITGDVVFNGLFPLIRDDVERWLSALDRLRQLEPQVVVPGHGPLGDARTIAWQRALIEDVYETVRNRYTAGVPVEEAAEEGPPERLARLPRAAERWPGAVRGVYLVLNALSGAG
jgi:cyclase